MTSASTVSLPLPGNPGWVDNWTRGLPGDLHGEVMDTTTGLVWLAQDPIGQEQYDALELPDGFVKTGIGEAVADAAYFARPPGADRDGPLEVREIGGLRFVAVARPGVPDSPVSGLFVLPVLKHHRVFYAAGRTIEVMDCGDGADYLPLVRNAVMAGRRRSATPRPRLLPEGWSVRTVTLAKDLVVDLPSPTRVTFFASGDSFQGPVHLGC